MRILYGVEGEGHGHATRSKAILHELIKKHDVLVAAGGKAYSVLNGSFNTVRIEYFPVFYSHSKNTVKVHPFITFFLNTIKFPYKLIYNLKLVKCAAKFKPDIVITDFESFTCWYGLLFRKPVISIDNHHIFLKTLVSKKLGIVDKFTNFLLTKFKIPSASYYLVFSFLSKNVLKPQKNTIVCKPVIREIFNRANKKKSHVIKDHVLIYQTANYAPVLNAIRQIESERFIVYSDKPILTKLPPHVIIKRFSEDDFPDDLASAKAVIINAGYSLMTEALYHKKPVLCFPIKNHYEQKLNALLLKESGYGDYSYAINQAVVRRFLGRLSLYKNNLKKYYADDNEDVINMIENIISRT